MKKINLNEYTFPDDYRPYTDKYFLRTNEILKKENINVPVSIKVFARGEGPAAGLLEAAAFIQRFAGDGGKGCEIWVSKKKRFANTEPLMILKGPIQSLAELETVYLGILSHAVTKAVGLAEPDPKEITEKLKRLKAIYGDIPIIYFGARHYHWSFDKPIAAAALDGGAVGTSTDIGSSHIGQKGVGTTPHILTILLASVVGKEQATLKTAQCFDKHMDPAIPRVTLVDTYNRELTDGELIADYFGEREHAFRVDTCGENVGEGGSLYLDKKQKDPTFQTGTGVTIELVTNLRNRLIKKGYGANTNIILSSGFGNEAKARAFVEAHRQFQKETGFPLFSGVGIGEVSSARFCTADIFEVDGKPLSKTGREAGHIDYNQLEKIDW